MTKNLLLPLLTGVSIVSAAFFIVSEAELQFVNFLNNGMSIIVTTSTDIQDGDVSSISNLQATPGADGEISLREAISAANNTMGCDTVRFDPSTDGNTIVLLPTPPIMSMAQGEDDNVDGDLDLTDMLGLVVIGNGPDNTIVSANDTARVIDGIEGDLIITGMTIRDGDADDEDNRSGAGIEQRGGDLYLYNCVVRNNRSDFGAGVYSAASDAHNEFVLTSFIENEAYGGSGGAFRLSNTDGSARIDSCISKYNVGNRGGGADFGSTRGTSVVTNSIISDNESSSIGGGINSAGNTSALLYIANCEISNNTATERGGGIDMSSTDGLMRIVNSTISGNSSNLSGGGISQSGANSTTDLQFVTMTNNTADAAGGGSGNGGGIDIITARVTDTATVNFFGSIIQGNSDLSNPGLDDCANSVGVGIYNTLGGNIFGNGTGCSPGPNDATDDAVLGPLADNGGFTQTHALLAGSAAVDFSSCDTIVADQRGEARDDGFCDAGAFERSFALKDCPIFVLVTCNGSPLIDDTLHQAGVINGRNYYIDAGNETEIIWDPVDNRWELTSSQTPDTYANDTPTFPDPPNSNQYPWQIVFLACEGEQVITVTGCGAQSDTCDLFLVTSDTIVCEGDTIDLEQLTISEVTDPTFHSSLVSAQTTAMGDVANPLEVTMDQTIYVRVDSIFSIGGQDTDTCVVVDSIEIDQVEQPFVFAQDGLYCVDDTVEIFDNHLMGISGGVVSLHSTQASAESSRNGDVDSSIVLTVDTTIYVRVDTILPNNTDTCIFLRSFFLDAIDPQLETRDSVLCEPATIDLLEFTIISEGNVSFHSTLALAQMLEVAGDVDNPLLVDSDTTIYVRVDTFIPFEDTPDDGLACAVFDSIVITVDPDLCGPTEGPQCIVSINVGINVDGQAKIDLNSAVANWTDADPADITVSNFQGFVILQEEDYLDDILCIDEACNFDSLKLQVSNEFGTCWTTVHLKSDFAPFVSGANHTVTCLDPLPDAEVVAIVPCFGPTLATYVADWIDADFACDNDTLKIVYREYEAYGKDGRRGSGFDTTTILRLPLLDTTNTFCGVSDSLYCGVNENTIVDEDDPWFGSTLIGPYSVIGQRDSVPSVLYDDLVDGILFDDETRAEILFDGFTQVSAGTNGNNEFFITVPAGKQLDEIVFDDLDGVDEFRIRIFPQDPEINDDIQLLEVLTFEPDSNLLSGQALGPGTYFFFIFYRGESEQFTVNLRGSCRQHFLAYKNGEIVPVMGDTLTKCLLIDYEVHPFESVCEDVFKVSLEIKQPCFATDTTEVTLPGGNSLEQLDSGYLRCEFWITDRDTVPPVIFCKPKATPDALIAYTNKHDCAAHAYIPDAVVEEDWSGIKTVKAIVEGIGTYSMEYDAEEECYQYHQVIKIPHTEEGVEITYEAYDSCHLVGRDVCYLTVKDNVKPVAVANKGIRFDVSAKKTWIPATVFDEESWDNCGIQQVLARRTDWYEACVDLCSDVDSCFATEHHDTIWQSILETDMGKDEVEAHYARHLEWLWSDDQACSELIYNAWVYDLIKHATLECKDAISDENTLHKVLRDELVMPSETNRALIEKFKCSNNIGPFASGDILFVASGNDTDSELQFADSDNGLYAIDLETGEATQVLDGRLGVEAMAVDATNNRIIFAREEELRNENGNTDEASQLWVLDLDQKAPRRLGYLTFQGARVEVEGLTFARDKLYAFAEDFAFIDDIDGIFEVDLETLDLTLLFDTEDLPNGVFDEWSIAYDPVTEKLYGVDAEQNDSIYEIDLENQVLKSIVTFAFQDNGIDPDGLAAGNGKLYIIDDDEAQDITVYDLINDEFSTLPNPFIENDSESGAAAIFDRAICGLAVGQVDELIDRWADIGGGWSDAVPFDCDDACQEVTVELLVIDYWCNYSINWTTVYPEDKTPPRVVKDVVDGQINCVSFKDASQDFADQAHPVSLQYIAELAAAGDDEANDHLDEVFGSYCPVWEDEHGNYVDGTDQAVTEEDCEIEYIDLACDYTRDTIQEKYFDEHTGEYIWKERIVVIPEREDEAKLFQKGLVVANCAADVEVSTWLDQDHCGEGYLHRKFKIFNGCTSDDNGHGTDTIYRHQSIWIGNDCELEKHHFAVPYDTTVAACQLIYDEDGSGQIDFAAMGLHVGEAKHIFDDDCRIVGIAKHDQVFKVVGGEEGCYKVIRKWIFMDWCRKGEPDASNDWYLDDAYAEDTILCVQKILVVDTLAPVCTITAAEQVNAGSGSCTGTFRFSVEITDDLCNSLTEYDYAIFEVLDGNSTQVTSGTATAGEEVVVADLPPGDYKLKVLTRDECGNEGLSENAFEVLSTKTPTPICISSLTVELTPWDSDGDGSVDTAKSILWAHEYNSSSAAPCGEADSTLNYYVEFVDGIDDNEFELDSASLAIGCKHVGTQQVRLWVVSESGASDYCDVLLTVQSNMGGCDDASSNVNDVISVKLGAKQDPRNKDFALYQNVPNPFEDQTQISFKLPEASEGQITIYDVTGKVLLTVEGDYSKGLNTVDIRPGMLKPSGVLYYQLDTEEYTATRKMVMIE